MAEANICTICLESTTNGKVLLTTACHHVFHYDCIMKNAKMNNNCCPLCRKPIQCSFQPLPTLADNFVDDDQWNCPSCTYLNSSGIDVCSICGQRRHQSIRRKDSQFQDNIRSFYSIDSVRNQPPCTNYLCHSKNSMSNILCDMCLLNSESQQDTAECQMDSYSQNELLINYSKRWVCSVCTYSNQESSQQCNICQQGFKPQSASVLHQSDMLQATKKGAYLSSNMSVSQEFRQIVEELRSNTAYHDLNLSFKKITSHDMNIILESFKMNTTVTSLQLSGCGLANNHLQLIAEILKCNKTLTDLSLSNNNIGDAGIVIISNVLKYNQTITVLTLCRNNIGDIGTTAIADILKCNRILTQLYLDDNIIGDTGGTAIANALSVNNTLQTLSMRQNQLSGIIKTMIDKSFKKNRQNSYSYIQL